MKTLILLLSLLGVTLCQQPPKVGVFEQRLPNGDQNEIVSIDLKRKNGVKDRIMAQLNFRLLNNKVFVNGQPIMQSVVHSVRMRISIVETRNGVPMMPRLAPVTFRVLVMGSRNKDGVLKKDGSKIVAEIEFMDVDKDEILQMDVKQIIWVGARRKPIVSVSIQESRIHHEPHEKDRRIFVPDPAFKPRLPSHGLIGNVEGYEHRFHGDSRLFHSEVLRWFKQLRMGGKIAVISAVVFALIGIIASVILCSKRYRVRKDLRVQVLDNTVQEGQVDEKEEKKEMGGDNISFDGQFHMEFDACCVDVDDKKTLVA